MDAVEPWLIKLMLTKLPLKKQILNLVSKILLNIILTYLFKINNAFLEKDY